MLTFSFRPGHKNTVRQDRPSRRHETPLFIYRTGDVYSLILGTKTLIILSSDEAVKELLDRRSSTYSDRQDMYIGQTLCSDGLRMLMMVRVLFHR